MILRRLTAIERLIRGSDMQVSAINGHSPGESNAMMTTGRRAAGNLWDCRRQATGHGMCPKDLKKMALFGPNRQLHGTLRQHPALGGARELDGTCQEALNPRPIRVPGMRE